MSYERNRGSVFLEDARILEQRALPGQQFVLRVQAPRAAARRTPGTFAHIACDPSVPLRRPLSIMRANATEGWLEFLYKPKGHGLDKLLGAPQPARCSACSRRSATASRSIRRGRGCSRSAAASAFRR